MKFIPQHDETDCAAACLAMIFTHFDKDVSLRSIRKFACTDTAGTSGFGVVKAAETFGLTCKSLVSDKKEIEKITFPSIFHTNIDDREHYIIVYKKSGQSFLVYDPAIGKKRISAEYLKSIWTGIFFIFSPTTDFKKSKDRLSFINFISLLKPYKKIVVQIFIASIILSIFGIITSFFFRFLIDEVLYSQIKGTLNICSLCYLLVILFQFCMEFCRSMLLQDLSTKLDVTLTADFFYHLLKLPLNFFSLRKTGEILSRLYDVSAIRCAVSSSSLSVCLDSIMILIGGAFLIRLGTRLVVIIIIPVLISAIVVWLLKDTFRRLIKEQAVLNAEKNALMYECINGISTIKALATERKVFEKSEEFIVDSGFKRLSLGRLDNIQESLQSLLSSFGTLALYWYGSNMIFDGCLTLGQLVSFSILSNFFLSPLTRVLTMQAYWQEVFVSIERLADIFEEKEETENVFDGEPVTSLFGEIEFSNVSFSYGMRDNAISNISLKIPVGKKVAFVGTSGSGKSTLIKLLMRFYKINNGNILIDGKNIENYKTDEYRKAIGYVPQECLLFSGTIQDNILWSVDCPQKEIMAQAAKDAMAYDFIDALPQKFNTVIGEHGATLSGGERQRIALGRVLATKHDILILDEASSCLDCISERAIMNCVYNIKNTTVIMVAHRLSTVKNCDCIFVFDKGKLLEQGTHSELLAKNGKYSELWRAQNE